MWALKTWREGGRQWVQIDTPGSSVNVFGHRPALELRGLLRALPSGITQLVLCSGKVGSFVNGAGLLYANSMKSAQGAVGISAQVRETYDLLADLPVQTVSLIEGNCYGCGLELALCCDVRVARNVYEAHFKMTELVDYRFVPLFGGTWRLPRRVGPAGAKRLLLDGETWSAPRARRAGLVDLLLPARISQVGIRRALDRLADAGPPSRRPRGVPRRALPVPPSRAALWEQTGKLIDAARRQSPRAAAAAELEAFARSVTSREAKAAMRFFFVRHMAHAASWGSSERQPPRIALAPPASPAPVSRVLRRRRPVVIPHAVLPVRVRSARAARVGQVELLWPLGVGGRLCEVRVPSAEVGLGGEIARYLDWIGFEPVLTRGAKFATQRLTLRTRQTVRALAEAGVSGPEWAAALWEFGFPRALLPPRRRLGPPAKTVAGPQGLLHPLLEAWREEIGQLVAGGVLFHPSQGEVLVHELFDFPLERGSVLWWLGQQGQAGAERRP